METTDKNNAKQESISRNNPAETTHVSERKAAEAAHEQAEHDISEDADLSIHSPNDDLDEGETARLGEDVGGII